MRLRHPKRWRWDTQEEEIQNESSPMTLKSPQQATSLESDDWFGVGLRWERGCEWMHCGCPVGRVLVDDEEEESGGIIGIGKVWIILKRPNDTPGSCWTVSLLSRWLRLVLVKLQKEPPPHQPLPQKRAYILEKEGRRSTKRSTTSNPQRETKIERERERDGESWESYLRQQLVCRAWTGTASFILQGV